MANDLIRSRGRIQHKKVVLAPKSPWKKNTASIARWLHIYLSMISFVIILFFAVTGLTLNHADWLDVMICFMKKKRLNGFILVGLGIVICFLVYYFLVP
jgi:hypothetical protein